MMRKEWKDVFLKFTKYWMSFDLEIKPDASAGLLILAVVCSHVEGLYLKALGNERQDSESGSELPAACLCCGELVLLVS